MRRPRPCTAALSRLRQNAIFDLAFDTGATTESSAVLATTAAATVLQRRFCSSAGTWHIGDVALPLAVPTAPEKIPPVPEASETYYRANHPQVVAYLRWLAQKDLLGQDVCLMGPPGPARRWLALRYCHMAGREARMLCLSRDTTEADIKQRKEIREGTLHYIDQAAVAAALKGDVLIIEGLERAERNVLPVINNLLENREMHLDNGKTLIHPKRYDQLAAEMGTAKLNDLGLLRVSEKFRVIGITVPTPQYAGNPLDPPLRSRFQCLYIHEADASAAWSGLLLAQKNAMSFGLQSKTLADAQGTDASAVEGDAPAKDKNSGEMSGQQRALAESMLRFREGMTRSEDNAVDSDSTGPKLPPLGAFEMEQWGVAQALFPNTPPSQLLGRVYPWQLYCLQGPKEDYGKRLQRIEAILQRSGLRLADKNASALIAADVVRIHLPDTKGRTPDAPGTDASKVRGLAEAEFSDGSRRMVRVGHCPVVAKTTQVDVKLPVLDRHHFADYHRHMLAGLCQSHVADRHMCVVGPAGCGKTVMVREFAAVFGYDTETVHLFPDMSTRDLLQRRTTNVKTGDTTWELSGLMLAAQHGRLAVLDGVDQLAPGTLAVLQQLLVDGSVTLYDGSVYHSSQVFDEVSAELQLSEVDLNARGVYRIHPAFRVIATARPPAYSGDKPNAWLGPEVATVFDVHAMTDMPSEHVAEVLASAARRHRDTAGAFGEPSSHATDATLKAVGHKLVRLQQLLETTAETEAKIPLLSLRQALRVAQYTALYPDELATTVHEALLLPLLTPIVADQVRRLVHEALGSNTGAPTSTFRDEPSLRPRSPSFTERMSGFVQSATGQKPTPRTPAGDLIGPTSLAVLENEEHGTRELSVGGQNVLVFPKDGGLSPQDRALVPHVMNFVPNSSHMDVAGWMLRQLVAKTPVLLVGNQGVGKNKIVDYLLSTAQMPRHYVQLHRDTTVSSLTVNPSVVAGKVVWEDSPLVKAASSGHVLVVDEIDKAPVEVVQVLKGLVEDKEMRLSDGRRITAWTTDDDEVPANVIRLHPDFRIIVLANPPGFPFHGNDFFRECGDLFACFVLGNPDKKSQEALLARYAPSVPRPLLHALIDMFAELSKEWDAGRLQYPFSVRELIAVARHLEKFPQDGVYQALNNVFHFDSTDTHTMSTVRRLVHTHLRRLGAATKLVLAQETPLPRVGSPTEMSVGDGTPVPITTAWPKVLSSTTAIDGVSALPLSAKYTDGGSRIVDPAAATQFTETRGLVDFDSVLGAARAALPEVQLGGAAVNKLLTAELGTAVLSNNVVVGLLATSAEGRTDFTKTETAATSEVQMQLVSFASPATDVGSTACPIPVGKVATVNLQNDKATALPGVAPGAPVTKEMIAEVCASNERKMAVIGAHTDVVVTDGVSGRLYFANPCTGEATVAAVPAEVDPRAEKDGRILFDLSASSASTLVLTSETPSPNVTLYKKGQFVRVTLPDAIVKAAVVTPEVVHCVLADKRHLLVKVSRKKETDAEGNETVSETELQATAQELVLAAPGSLPASGEFAFVPNRSAFSSNAVGSTSAAVTAEDLHGAVAVSSVAGSGGSPSIVFKTTVSGGPSADGSSAAPLSVSMQGHSVAGGGTAAGASHYDVHSGQIVTPMTSGGAVGVVNTESMTSRSVNVQGSGNGQASGAHVSSDGFGVSVVDQASGQRAAAVVDTNAERLRESHKQWSSVMSGAAGGSGDLGAPPSKEELKMWYSKPKKESTGKIKHGEVDDLPHSGGNTYAGGTGGTDTAGLGGMVGPYRLDKGFDISQVSPEDRKKVPPHLVDEARRMGKEALDKRLKEIGMSASEDETYKSLCDMVRAPAAQLQVMLQGLKAKEGERVWLRNQSDGTWDDTKLVEGITGEKNIYKRRVDPKDDPNKALQFKKKKRLLFLMDVSASMYRFNRHDRRLQRLLETSVMVMEGLVGHEDKIEYAMVGHNGDHHAHELVKFGQPPKNRKERLDVCMRMAAHSQYCWSGDTTLKSMKEAIPTVLSEPGDGYYVFLISDANLAQYGYHVHDFTKVIKSDPRVHMYCLFIASFGAQASRLQECLPAGHGFECIDPREMPQVLKRIFVATDVLGR